MCFLCTLFDRYNINIAAENAKQEHKIKTNLKTSVLASPPPANSYLKPICNWNNAMQRTPPPEEENL